MGLGTKRKLLIAFGFALSGAALVFFIHRLRGHWTEVFECFRQADYRYLALGIAMLFVLYWFRVVRWRLFLRPIKRVSGLSATSATCIGFMANNTLPIRLGELIRPYLLHRKEGVGFAHALATVGLARVFDLIGLSVLLLITWALLPSHISGELPAGPGPEAGTAAVGISGGQPGTPGTQGAVAAGDTLGHDDGRLVGRVWRGGLVLVVLAAIFMAFLLGLAVFPAPFLKAGEVCTRFLPVAWRGSADNFLRSITEAMGFLKDWKGVALAVAYSVGLWLSQGLGTYALALALGLELGLGGSFLAVIAVSAAVALPQAPGYLGVFQLAAALAAESFQVGKADAGAFALLMWLVNIVPITLVGLGFLWYEGLSLRKLTAASQQMGEKTGAGK